MSLPAWGRGLKPILAMRAVLTWTSLPAWGRGLKLRQGYRHARVLMSLPAWGRGLKLIDSHCPICDLNVAPRVGAWIETIPIAAGDLTSQSLPAWGRGLKHLTLDQLALR